MNAPTDTFSVPLPSRMLADDLLALGHQLNARYVAVQHSLRKGAPPAPQGCPAGVPIPATVAASRKRLDAALVALRASANLRHESADPRPDASGKAPAITASRAAWQVFHAWLAAWSKGADDGQTPTREDAQALFGKVFPTPEGLRFITWRSRRQWTAMQVRMDILLTAEATATVTALGGERLLATLLATHASFGHTFAFTAAKGVSPSATAVVLPQFTAAKGTLRDYVMKVTGSADRDIRESEALAAWLLGPFNEMLAEFAAQSVARPRVTPTPDAPTT